MSIRSTNLIEDLCTMHMSNIFDTNYTSAINDL